MSRKIKQLISIVILLFAIGGKKYINTNIPIKMGISNKVNIKSLIYNTEERLVKDELNEKDLYNQGVNDNLETEFKIYNNTTECAVKIVSKNEIENLNSEPKITTNSLVRIDDKNNKEFKMVEADNEAIEKSSAESAADIIKKSFEDFQFNDNTSKEEIVNKINLQLEKYNGTTDCVVKINTNIGKNNDGFESFYNDLETQEISFKVVLIDQKGNNSVIEIEKIYKKITGDSELLKNFEIADDKNGGIIITKYKGEDSVITIPEKIEGKNVVEIGNNAFEKSRIRVLDIPSTVQIIGSNAFAECTDLSEVYIHNNISIGAYSFYKCVELKYIEFDSKNQRINLTLGNHAFDECSSLSEIKNQHCIGKMNIGDYAFYQCYNLNNIDISNAESIGNSAFRGCSGLSNINIPEIKSIGNDAFSLCSGLKSLNIPDSVESIGEYAFYGCDGLTSINIPSAINIGRLAFCKCSNLKNIRLPEGTTKISMGEFHGCSNLSKIEIPETVESIGIYAFVGCDRVEAAIIPSHISDNTEIEKINSKYEIIYKINNQECVVVTDIKFKTDNINIVIPEKIYNRPVYISEEAVKKLSEYNNKVVIYTREIYNSLVKKIDLDRIIMVSDKSKLQSLYDSYINSEYDSSKFTENSSKVYEDALKHSKNIIDDKYSDQLQIDEAYNQLIEAKSGLEIKNDPVKPDDGKTDIDKPDNNKVSNHHSSHGGNNTEDYTEIIQNEAENNNEISLEEKKCIRFNKGWNFIDGKWFYILHPGECYKGWYKDLAGRWYMLDKNTGEMDTGWFKDENGKWYYFDVNGVMKTGWIEDSYGKWYYLDISGAMVIGWFKDTDGNWYYLYEDGSMAVSTYIDQYKIGRDGVWINN